MSLKAFLFAGLTLVAFISCTNTRYITDQATIHRQHNMRSNRIGKNIGIGCLNVTNMVIAGLLNAAYQPIESERAFRHIILENQSSDTLNVNMVTDVVWKEDGYCDIMGIVLPPAAKQKLLVPYPAAYNVYFKSPFSEEEKLEIRTDSKLRIFRLKPVMTKTNSENN